MLKSILENWREKLKEIYPIREIDNFFFIVIDHFFNISKIDMILNRYDIGVGYNNILDRVLIDLVKEKPIQYIVGEASFMDRKFKVNSSTLIPRPETEELVKWIKEGCTKYNVRELKILDIGTGSGIIAISLSLDLGCEVWALDICKKAIKVAEKNSELLGSRVNFLHLDILEDFVDEKFDIIVSNPPYVMEKEKKQIKNNVLKYEPHDAIFVKDDNPLIYYNAILNKSDRMLKQNGFVYFEINENMCEKMCQLLEEKGFEDIEIREDFFGRKRMIRGILR